MRIPARSSRFLLWTTVALGQTLAPHGTLPVCPECGLAAQLGSSFGPPQVVFLENPKPLTSEGRVLRFGMTARIVSTRPLVFDVLDLDASMKREAEGSCGFMVLPIVDAKLKPVLSRVKFNQVVKLNLFFGGNPKYPNEFVLSELALDAQPNSGAGVCPNRTGIAISYRGAVEYVNVYNDGSIYFRDGSFNSFSTQKLSRDEMAQLMKAAPEQTLQTVHEVAAEHGTENADRQKKAVR
jgi:hypothetical protein